MSIDYSSITVKGIEKEIEGILKKQLNQDDLFRLAVFTGQLDVAKFIYHDRKYQPDTRHKHMMIKSGETVAYGQTLVQLLLLMKSRGMDFTKVFEYAIEHMKDDEWKEKLPQNDKEVKGLPVAGGRVIGKAYVVSGSNPVQNTPKNSIVVMEHATPEVTEQVLTSRAVVTDQGGRLCHLAIVARERGLPVIVGTGNATTLIRTGDRIMVDADNGIVKRV